MSKPNRRHCLVGITLSSYIREESNKMTKKKHSSIDMEEKENLNTRCLDLAVYIIVIALNITVVLLKPCGINWALILLLWTPGAVIVPQELYQQTKQVNLKPNTCQLLVKGLGSLISFPSIIVLSHFKFFWKSADTGHSTTSPVVEINAIVIGFLNVTVLLVVALHDQFDNEDNVIDCLIIVTMAVSMVLYLRGSTELLAETFSNNKINLLPFLTATMVFRTFAFAVILVNLSYLSIVPIAGLIIASLAKQGLKTSEENEGFCYNGDGEKCVYATVWTGRKWTRKYLQNQFVQEKGGHGSDNSMIFRSFVRLVAPLFGNKDKYKETKSVLIENILIVMVLIISISFVSFVMPAVQASTIISSQGKLLNIILIVASFGIISPCLLHINGCNLIVQLLRSTLILLVILISLVFLIFLSTSPERNSYQSYLFTISSNSSGIHVDILARLDGNKNFEEVHDAADIIWDVTCSSETDFKSKTLIFADFQNSACRKLLKTGSNATILSINEQQFKSSRVNVVNDDFILEKINKSLDYLYIGNLTYIMSIARENAICSSSLEIELNPTSKPCSQYKYISNISMIRERQCLKIDNELYDLDVNCNATIDSSYVPMLNGMKANAKVLYYASERKFTSCCLNDTYAIKLFGKCKTADFSVTTENLTFHQKPCQEDFYQHLNIGYMYQDECLTKISFQSACNSPKNILSTCYRINCNDVTI